MLARLGDVLYWLGSGIAVVLIAWGVILYAEDRGPWAWDWWVPYALLGVPAVVAWLIGRACRYVLGGK
jgi:hypothetical protein